MASSATRTTIATRLKSQPRLRVDQSYAADATTLRLSVAVTPQMTNATVRRPAIAKTVLPRE